jgi:hypothetical protein
MADIAASVQPQPGDGLLSADHLTPAQKQHTACFECGAPGPLVPAGYAYTKTSGAPLGWAVVACPNHAPQGNR